MEENQISRTERLTQALAAALQGAPVERAIPAMSVVIQYTAMIGRVILDKRGEEYVFRMTRTFEEGSSDEIWTELPCNAYAIRDEFQKVKTPTDALDFLSNTGKFSNLSDAITWSEFRKWQRFAYLVQEHDALASAMEDFLSGSHRVPPSGECVEALMALTGDYPSAFFDVPPAPQTARETRIEAEMSEAEARMRRSPEADRAIREGELLREKKRRSLWKWFHHPPKEACSLQWIPDQKYFNQELKRKLRTGGAMLEFLLPRKALRPALLIRPENTLEAVAAAIHADRTHSVEYRTCEVCCELFKIGAHGDKRYCTRGRCKNTAHQRRMRAKRSSTIAKETPE